MNIRREDIITPANAVSVMGLMLVVAGSLRLDTLPGVILIGTGRLLDIADGYIARRTRTSEFGAALDASLDKLAILVIVTSALWYQAVPWPLLLWVFGQNLVNAMFAIAAWSRGRPLHSSLYGKRTIFLQNLAIGLLLLAHFVPEGAIETFVVGAGVIAGAASVPLGLHATKNYAHQLLH